MLCSSHLLLCMFWSCAFTSKPSCDSFRIAKIKCQGTQQLLLYKKRQTLFLGNCSTITVKFVTATGISRSFLCLLSARLEMSSLSVLKSSLERLALFALIYIILPRVCIPKSLQQRSYSRNGQKCKSKVDKYWMFLCRTICAWCCRDHYGTNMVQA